MKKGHGLLYSLIVLMIVIWSANFIVGKLALREFPPLLLGGLRVALAGAFIFPVYWWAGRDTTERWTRSDLPVLLGLGLLGVALNQIFFIYGLSRTSVAHSAIIAGLSPILVLLIGAAVKLEQITPRKVAGLLVALSGVAVLKIFEQAGNTATWTGDAFVFLANLTFSLFTVFGKRAAKFHSAVTVNTFAYVGGAVALAPVTLAQGWHFPFAQVSAWAWMSLAYMALFPSVIAYLIYYHALRHISASRVSAFTYLQPLLATLMGVTVLGERVTLSLAVGGGVIFCGVYLTERG